MSELVEWLTATLDQVEREARDAAAAATWTGTELLRWVVDGDDLVGERPAFTEPPHPYYSLTGRTHRETIISIECWDGAAVLVHMAAHDPASVVASVEADRAILHACEIALEDSGLATFAAAVLPLVASRYRHRPGWDPAWTPEGMGGAR